MKKIKIIFFFFLQKSSATNFLPGLFALHNMPENDANEDTKGTANPIALCCACGEIYSQPLHLSIRLREGGIGMILFN